ncbi:uncharacterized protein LOC112595119 [Melanaphis sacchari]|uniref:uncharacterized protein LOC112595119 n=1 Tax=Melanaphis sacchari TaxID=742174 RepID=UPI000DC13238|nr:uncharacterized protein LOC112595119 [Melanaphis sacchari]
MSLRYMLNCEIVLYHTTPSQLRLKKVILLLNNMGMLSTIVSFGLGVYTGLYAAQNYEVAKVDDPGVIIDKMKKYLDEIMKPKP